MDTSITLANASTAPLQTTRPLPPRGEEREATPGAPAAAPESTQVNISAEARAAEQAARSAGVPPAAAPVAQAASADPVQASSATQRAEATPSATARPAAAAESANAARAVGAPAESPAGGSAPAGQPDAPTTAASPAAQLYLDNAGRPETQPTPSAVRTSA
ncbi:hypothetical protein IAI53_04175 [Thauera sp. CAU 1555]|uniref:Uncharacterized protein n=1 Tax=Thauera sedimentorum TaxID=2767595 RepID=A0ABR9B819_9RHOO|nr:hypothetical protein [Thauera sedimentorum]MBC9071150.1 hypothetical protein [Thauera sedimentorum]MBD8502069.1 hypothetical protein [Thauera sedimentorum]